MPIPPLPRQFASALLLLTTVSAYGADHAPTQSVAPPSPAAGSTAPAPLASSPAMGMALLGGKLFFDPRLSRTGKTSCSSCHHMVVRHVASALEIEGHLGCGTPFFSKRNNCTIDFSKPSVINLTYAVKAGFKEELDAREEEAARTLKGLPDYPLLFQRAFPGEPDPLTADTLVQAMTAFVTSIFTVDPVTGRPDPVPQFAIALTEEGIPVTTALPPPLPPVIPGPNPPPTFHLLLPRL